VNKVLMSFNKKRETKGVRRYFLRIIDLHGLAVLGELGDFTVELNVS